MGEYYVERLHTVNIPKAEPFTLFMTLAKYSRFAHYFGGGEFLKLLTHRTYIQDCPVYLEKYIREELLTEQVKSFLQKVSLPTQDKSKSKGLHSRFLVGSP
jgi:hypothetical protein